jgi:hypothetical protein
MSEAKKLVALEQFVYPFGTRILKPGDVFEAVSDRDREALLLTKRARDFTEPDDIKPRARGRYPTRVMQPDTEAA